MTLEQAREIMAKASSATADNIKGGARTQARRAIRFVRHSSKRTYNDMELATMVEVMLDTGEKRWPEPHEIVGAVLFDNDLDGAEMMAEFVVELTKHERKFKMQHESGQFRVRMAKPKKEEE